MSLLLRSALPAGRRLAIASPLARASLATTSSPARNDSGDPYLLTPGPLSTALSTKQAMLHDYGSRDETFIAFVRDIRRRLIDTIDAESTHSAVLLQGSGSFCVEATLGSLIPRKGKALILNNGAYGRRMITMMQVMQRPFVSVELGEKYVYYFWGAFLTPFCAFQRAIHPRDCVARPCRPQRCDACLHGSLRDDDRHPE